MRLAKKLTLLAFIGVGAGSLLASCGDNAQTCGPGTEPNEDGICLPNGGGPDAEPNPDDPDAEPGPDADSSPTVSGTLAVFDSALTDPSAIGAFGSFRGGSIRFSFNDLTDPNRGGIEVFRGGSDAPISSCLVVKYDADHPPYDRLDAGAITVSGTGLVKDVGSCTLQGALGDPDPYRCVSDSSTSAVIAGTKVTSSAAAYSFPGVDFGMTTPLALANVTRGSVAGLPAETVQVTTSAAHGFKTGQFVVIAGVSDTTFNSPTVSGITVGFPVQVTGATTFVFKQTGSGFGFATVNASGTASGAVNTITSSSLIVNGFTAGPNAPKFNSGATTSLFVIAQMGAATVLAVNSAMATVPDGTSTLGATGSYTFLNASSPVPTTGTFDAFQDFLSGAVTPATATVRIQKPAQAGVWGAIDFTVDVPGEAPPAVAAMSLSRQNTAFRDLGAATTGNLDTVIQAKVPGTGGNSTTIQLVADGTGAGTLNEAGFPAVVFHFQTGTTTIANFEAAITASTNLAVRTPDATGTDTFAAGDVLAAMNLTRGGKGVTVTMTAGHGISVGQKVTIANSAPSTAVIAAASRSDATNVVVVTTATPHGLGAVGSYAANPFPVAISGATAVIPNGTYFGVQIVSANTFVVFFDNASDVANTPGGTATTKSYNGTFAVSFADATTFRYLQDGNDAAAAAVPGTVQKSSFALDTSPSTGTASQQPHAFPTSTAANTADLNYSCDNNTTGTGNQGDDTCGDSDALAADSPLKAMIISGSATKKSVDGLFPFQMPAEVSGDSEWLEWQCAFLVPNTSATMPIAAVQAIIDFKPTRIEQQVLFVGGTILDDPDNDNNAGGLKVLAGHALAGHQTFCPNAGAGAAATGFGQVCPACSDGIDNDGAGGTDFPADTDCSSATDPGGELP